MEKLVVILSKTVEDVSKVADELDKLPGVAVTARSRSLIDVEVSAPSAESQLRSYAQDHGFEVEQASEPQMIEPIPPFKAR